MLNQPLDVEALDARTRYQLLTSLVVPRPIAWVSTYSAGGRPNLAPFSYFAALSASPMLVGISIGHRRASGPKDSLRNIREAGAFCVNVVTEAQLEAMNLTSGEYPAEVDEFELAKLPLQDATAVPAPFVRSCPAVLECRFEKEVDLAEAPNTLVIGRVVALRLDPGLPFRDGSSYVDPEALRPVGRMGGTQYRLGGRIVDLERPG